MNALGDNRLGALAADVRAAHQAVNAGALAVAEKAIDCGHALIEAKTLLKHGQWGAWLQDHCGLSERSARRYMQVARSGLETATVADLGIRGAAAAVGKSKAKPPVDHTEVAALVTGWWVNLFKWARLPAAARRRERMAFVETWMEGADDPAPLIQVYLRQTRDIEEAMNSGELPPLHGVSDDKLEEAIRSFVAAKFAQGDTQG